MINPVHTSCKNCVFASYTNKTQTGCELKYIDQFKKNHEEILEAYDDDLDFYIINNKKCLGYRELAWFKSLDMEHSTVLEKKEYFIKNNHINYLLVIDLQNMNSNLETLKKTILDAPYKPQKIILIRCTQDVDKFSFDLLNQFLIDAQLSNISWRIQTMTSEEHEFENTLHTIISLNKKNRFIAYIRNTKNNCFNLADILVKANDIVYNNMQKFDIISDSEKRCVIFSAPSYRFEMLVLKKDIFQESEKYIYV